MLFCRTDKFEHFLNIKPFDSYSKLEYALYY